MNKFKNISDKYLDVSFFRKYLKDKHIRVLNI